MHVWTHPRACRTHWECPLTHQGSPAVYLTAARWGRLIENNIYFSFSFPDVAACHTHTHTHTHTRSHAGGDSFVLKSVHTKGSAFNLSVFKLHRKLCQDHPSCLHPLKGEREKKKKNNLLLWCRDKKRTRCPSLHRIMTDSWTLRASAPCSAFNCCCDGENRSRVSSVALWTRRWIRICVFLGLRSVIEQLGTSRAALCFGNWKNIITATVVRPHRCWNDALLW